MAGTNTSWDEVLDGLDVPAHTPSSSPSPEDTGPSRGQQARAAPGFTDKGQRSPLIRTRRADLAWVLGAPLVKILTLISVVALGGAAVVLYAVPSVDAWWQEQTNPAPPVVETQEPVVIDGDPVLYGVEDTEVDHGADFDPMEGVRALDPEDGDITEDVQLQGEVDTTEPGTHAVRYEVEDSARNTTHHWRTITVRAEPEAEEEDEDTQEEDESVEPEPEPETEPTPRPQPPPSPAPPPAPTPAPQPTQPPAPAPTPSPSPAPTQTPPPQPSAPRVSTQASVTCTGNATVVFTATGGGNVVLSGSVNASGAGSASGSATVNGGGNVNATATADGNVRIAYEWSGTGTCS